MSAILTTTQFLSANFTPIRFSRLGLNKARPVTKQVSYVCCRWSLTEGIKNGGTLVSVAIGITLATPLSALSVPSISPTPFSESQDGLQLGLENGIIRPCPSTNPTCISTTSRSASFALPWIIPQDYSDNVIKKIEDAILKTQKNAKIVTVEDTPSGQYLQAEVDGSFGRDVMEFLVKKDTVTYRSLARKVIYVYPFTTAFGNPKSQEERLDRIVNELGWYVPSFDSMY